MPTIDDKVVAMSFESSKFESGVSKTISAIDRLKAALHFPGAGKGLQDIDAAAKRVNLGHISQGVDGIKRSLETLRLIGIGVLSQLATQAIRAGARFASAFTLDPIKAGFSEYTTNLNAVQTILANTQAAGTGLKDVNAALKQLNEYSDQTIYNFSQMARNIGTFTAAGVDLDTAVGSIKGIANLAALSGSNAEQAATAMYQLSQAISAGRVSLQDWNSVVNAGMGGTVFQRALAQTAVAMGSLEESSLKLVGPMKNVSIAGESFRQSISAAPGKQSWLTSKVLTATLEQFTGDLTKAELKAQGFNDAQIKAIQATAITAKKAATEVKTLSGVIDTAKETAVSGWAETWQIIFGDFEEAKTLFTGISGAINGFIKASADARNKILSDWKALGGRTALIESFKNVFEALGDVIEPIKKAFTDIFPPMTGQRLYDLTIQFREFTETLKPSPETIDNIRRTFRGLFAVLDIGKQVISGIFGVFRRLFNTLTEGEGSFLGFTARIGDFLVSVDQALKKGDGLKNFFDGLGDILEIPIKLLKELAAALGDLFSGFSSGGFSEQMGGMTAAMTPFQKVMEAISTAWSNFIDSIGDSGVLEAALEGFVKFIQGIGPAIGNAVTNINFEAILAVIRTGLFGGLVLMFKQFLGKGSFLDQVSKGFAGGIIENISGTFKALEGSMTALQQNIKAKTLKEIAIAIALLTASVVALSFVDAEGLKKSLTAITVMFGQLLGAMAILDKIAVAGGFVKLPVIAGALILLAGAIDILAIAVFALSKLSWDELIRGLTGVGGLLAGMAVAVKPLSAGSAGLIRASIGIGLIAISMKILASAMADFGKMARGEIGKGLAGVAGGLTALTAAMRAMPVSGMVAAGVAIIAISYGLGLLADVVEKFSSMDWKSMGKGLAGVGGALVIIAGAMQLMPKSMAITAAGLLLVALSLGKISDAIIKMGGMSIKEIAKGLGTLAGALTILAAAMYAMTGTLAGAAALAVAAVGISLLAGALTKLGSMSWGEILKSLVALGAALAVVGVAGALLSPTIPALLGLGAALLLIGAGLALAGAGVFLVGAGLSAIAVAGPAAIGIMVAAFKEFTQAVIENAKLIVLGVLEIVEQLADTAPKFVDAIVKIVEQLINAIIKLMPKFTEAFQVLLDAALKLLAANQNKIIQAGFDLLMALLKGIERNLPQIVNTVADIIAKFLSSLSQNMNKIVSAGVDLLVEFLKGVAKNISNVISAAADIVAKFITGIINSYGDIIDAGADALVEFLKGISNNISDAIAAGTDVVISLIEGIGNAASDVVTAAVDTMATFLDTLATESVKLVDAGFKAIIKFMNGIANAIDENAGQMQLAGGRIALAIINGLTFGLANHAQSLYNKATEIMNKVVGILKKIPIIGSPSKVTTEIGENIILGLVKGVDDTAPKVYKSAEVVSKGVIRKFEDTFQTRSPSEVMIEIGKAVGQGFAVGLRGSQEDINQAFREMNEKLLDAMADARETITSEQEKLADERERLREQEDKLAKERADKKPDADTIKRILDDIKESQETIKEIQAVITLNEDILKRTTAGHETMIRTLKDEKRELFILAGDYERITENLDKARQALEDIKQARADVVRTTAEAFAARPELDTTDPAEIKRARDAIAEEEKNLRELRAAEEKDQEAITRSQIALDQAKADLAKIIEGKVLDKSGLAVDQLKTYEQALVHQTNAVGAYNATLQQLRKLGLDDATYQKLVDDGVADQAFATQLLAGGRQAVEKLNKLDKKLVTVSEKLGTNVGKELFASGQKAAQGIVDGLEDKKDTVSKKMKEIGEEMVAALKKSLGMKSPSKEMIEIAESSIEGLVIGFTKNGQKAVAAVESVSMDMMKAIQNSMSNVVMGELNTNPVITPVLDLSLVRTQARELNTLTSYGQAINISAQQTATQAEQVAATTGTSVMFNQNNYSPEALNAIEIYRQTRNQISQLKSALALT